MAHLYRGGRLHAPRHPGATACLVENGLIAWIGADDEASSLTLPEASVIDLDGALVTPGFVDAHVHATSTGLTLLGLDLSWCESANDILDAVAAEAGRNSAALILGHGWDESSWADLSLPSSADLERVAPGRRVYLTRVDSHSALVSWALLEAVPQARSLRGFHESGRVTQEAHHVLRGTALGGIDDSTRARAQAAFLDTALRTGIVSVHEMAGPVISSADDCRGLLELARERAGIHVQAYWGELAQSGGMDRAREIGAAGAGGDLFADGSLGSHTACLHEPYADSAGKTGRAFLGEEELVEHVSLCVRAGMQTGFHAIGDAATDAVVAAFRLVAREQGVDRLRAQRHRIEHAESMTESSISACRELGLVASMQPVFDARWGGDHGMYARRLGVSRAGSLNAIGDLRAAGVTVAFGSDAPVTPLDPWGAVHASLQHHSASQRISLETALESHTRMGWCAAGIDGVGDIEVGAPAHLAIWHLGEGQVIPAPGAQSLRTLVAGQPAWDAGVLDGGVPC